MNMKIMRRGEILLSNSDPTIGDEIGKIRPAIIVNSDKISTFSLAAEISLPTGNFVR